MRRRSLLCLPLLALLLPVGEVLAADPEPITYSRAAFDAAIASGKPFLLDFKASW
jgi:hypothetical protein